jgi:hypothetical protein
MIGNQAIINGILKDHPDNPIKENIGKLKVDDILYVINHEYWKQWKKDIVHSEIPYIYTPGLGMFKLRLGRAKHYMRKLVRKLRWWKYKYADTYQKENTRAYGMYNSTVDKFRATWKQVDKIKQEIIDTNEIWKQKKLKKYGDKAIL